MIGWYKESFLTASSAIQTIARLTDFTRNTHAESFNKELGRTSPDLLRRFGIEKMLADDGTRQSVLVIIRQYVNKRQLIQKVEVIVKELLDEEEHQKTVFDFINANLDRKQQENKNESIIGLLHVDFSPTRTSQSNKSGEERSRTKSEFSNAL